MRVLMFNGCPVRGFGWAGSAEATTPLLFIATCAFALTDENEPLTEL
jgi:hypothetical protein